MTGWRAGGRDDEPNRLDQVRAALTAANPVFAEADRIVPAAWEPFGGSGPIATRPFAPAIESFYLTNPIARASVTMAECVAVARAEQPRTGTHG